MLERKIIKHVSEYIIDIQSLHENRRVAWARIEEVGGKVEACVLREDNLFECVGVIPREDEKQLTQLEKYGWKWITKEYY